MRKLTLADIDLIQPLLQQLQDKLWVYYTPVILSNESVYIGQVEGATLLLFRENGNWDLLVQPLGDCSNGTLEEVFAYLEELNGNGNGSIYNCTASFASHIKKNRFISKVECSDYIYSKEEQLAMCGGRFSEIRNHINYFKKNYKFKVSAYTADDYDECDRLFNGWKAKKEANIPVKDEHVAQLFQNLYLFPDMFGIVMRVEDKVVGFSLGGLLSSDEAICIIRKTDYTYKGLSEFVDHEFYKCVPESVRLVNDGDDLDSPSLRQYKSKWNPVGFRQYYTVENKLN